MEAIIVIVVIVVVAAVLSAISQGRELERAKQAYQASLARLTAHPANNQLRIETLETGRRYADLARKAAGSRGRVLFDEIALNNDLSARVATQPALSLDTKKCPRCAEHVKQDAQICRFCQYDFARGAA